MAFKRDISKTYRWPVSMPFINENGEVVDFSLNIHFARLPMSEIAKIQEELTGTAHKDENSSSRPAMTDEQFLNRVVKGWDGYYGDDDKEIPFSPEEFKALCDVMGCENKPMSVAIVAAFFDSLREGAVKNSKQPPKDGQALPVVQH